MFGLPTAFSVKHKTTHTLTFVAISLMPLFTNAQLMEEVSVDGNKVFAEKRVLGLTDALTAQGVNFYSAGGVAKLPVLRGLNDDRVKLLIDGVETTSACANHMNPALSYVNTVDVEVSNVMAGITPVSMGGDSIAGTIVIKSAPPLYAATPDTIVSAGYVDTFYGSNDRQSALNFKGSIASDAVYVAYNGHTEHAQSYNDGNGNKVLDTLYRTENHSVTVALRGPTEELILKASQQKVPYQGFANQYMDMTGNNSNSVNLNYVRTFNWGQLDSRFSWQDVGHTMGFFTDEKTGSMPMNTVSKEGSYSFKIELPLTAAHTLNIGHEYHDFTLDDWWPAVSGSMMMGPNDFINMDDAYKTRVALFAESIYLIDAHWRLLGGIRYEHVETNAGRVQPYSTNVGGMQPNLDAGAAAAFNAAERRRQDNNIDITVLGRYQPTQGYSAELGYARKTRTPNLYERYSWGQNTMAMTMIGWFGDGNGYVGDINLQPEIAHTLGFTLTWSSAEAERWSVSVAPYYTYIDDYIDVKTLGYFNPRMAMDVTRSRLQFTNQDAEIIGADLQGSHALWENTTFGVGRISTKIAYTRGQRTAGDESDLYQIMPLQISTTLKQSKGNWHNSLVLDWVDQKTNVDTLRHENTTASYFLVNLDTQLTLNAWTFNVSINNVLDKSYQLPLGGVSIAQWNANNRVTQLEQLAGKGRSINVGVRFAF